MATWDLWFPEVLVSVPGCPDPLVRQALNRAARDFLHRTRAWCEWLEPVVNSSTELDAQYDFEVPNGSEIVVMEYATINGKPLRQHTLRTINRDMPRFDAPQPGMYSEDRQVFSVTGGVPPGQQIQIRATLKPTLTASGIPDYLANQHFEAIASGALAVLLSKRGTPFSDLSTAAIEASKFEAAIGSARAAVYMGHTTTMPRNKLKMC